MIAIGRNAAAAAFGGRVYWGFFAWLLWLLVHLARLIGFRNRLLVLVNWAWDYALFERAVRFVFAADTRRASGRAGDHVRWCDEGRTQGHSGKSQMSGWTWGSCSIS